MSKEQSALFNHSTGMAAAGAGKKGGWDDAGSIASLTRSSPRRSEESERRRPTGTHVSAAPVRMDEKEPPAYVCVCVLGGLT